MTNTSSTGRSYLGTRLDVLRRTQNADGGWGYFPGKASWLEPTAYAAMVLHGEPAADRAWQLLLSWQEQDGGWRSSGSVPGSCWGTSLCVTLATGRKEWGDAVKRGVSWLTDSTGAESNWLSIAIGFIKRDRDFSLKAWPWKPGDSSWVEPTAHALVALKQTAPKFSSSALRERIRQGEAQLLDVRARDGGWNYGARSALGVDLPSYPETTALALLGLQERSDLGAAIDSAKRQLNETPSPLGRAWLTIAMQVHGIAGPEQAGDCGRDMMITAVEALAAPEGNHWFMKTSSGVWGTNRWRS